MSETRTRSITGAIFGLVVVAAVSWSFWTNAVLWIFIGLQGMREMHNGSQSKSGLLRIAFAVAVSAWVYLMCQLASGPLGSHAPWQVLSLLILIWSNDSGAYFIGKPFGKNKLMPSVSPGKSWEGFAGGAAFAAIAAGFLFGWSACWIGPLMAVLATAGDLLESAWKRSNGLKDSGAMMPGHGGVLDRFDGFTIAAPAYAIILYSLPFSFHLKFLYS